MRPRDGSPLYLSLFFVVTLIVAASPPAAQGATADLAARIDAAAARLAPEIVEVRHQIHREPELGNREPAMGGEDFAFFADVVPGFYFRLGTTLPGTTSGGLHTPTFRADDGAVAVGMRAMARMVADFLVGE